MTPLEIQDVIKLCSYPGFTFHMTTLTRDFVLGDPCVLQVEFTAQDSWTQTTKVQKGRGWLLFDGMTRNEIVQTCWLAVKTALEHEARENFRYHGRTIFSPHFDPDALYAIATRDHYDLRGDDRPDPGASIDSTYS